MYDLTANPNIGIDDFGIYTASAQLPMVALLQHWKMLCSIKLHVRTSAEAMRVVSLQYFLFVCVSMCNCVMCWRVCIFAFARKLLKPQSRAEVEQIHCFNHAMCRLEGRAAENNTKYVNTKHILVNICAANTHRERETENATAQHKSHQTKPHKRIKFLMLFSFHAFSGRCIKLQWISRALLRALPHSFA